MAEAVVEGRRERRKRELRGKIYETARQLFLEQGFEGTTVAQIAEAADIAPGTFFNHFTSKQAVLAEMTNEVRRTLTRGLASDMESAGVASGLLADVLAVILIGMAEAGIRATEVSPEVDPDAVVDLLTGITTVGLVGMDKSILTRLVQVERDATAGHGAKEAGGGGSSEGGCGPGTLWMWTVTAGTAASGL